jgi:hypothetical protein
MALLLMLLLSTACGRDSSAERAAWTYTAQPGGTELLFDADFDASCSRFLEWRVVESEEELEVLAIVRDSGPEDCPPALLASERYSTRVFMPLGDRRLVGCDPQDEDVDCSSSGLAS